MTENHLPFMHPPPPPHAATTKKNAKAFKNYARVDGMKM